MTPVQLILRCEHLLGLAVQDGADPEKCVLPAPKNELAAARRTTAAWRMGWLPEGLEVEAVKGEKCSDFGLHGAATV